MMKWEKGDRVESVVSGRYGTIRGTGPGVLYVQFDGSYLLTCKPRELIKLRPKPIVDKRHPA